MVGLVQPTKAILERCSIGGVPYHQMGPNGDLQVNFHVKEFRIYEDICKPYFTGQLVIETMLNAYEYLLQPTAEVYVGFSCPRSDNGPTRSYSERFRIYSYDSKPIGGGADVRIEHTISLIGQEYYNDKHNVVTQNFKLTTGVSAATKIHGYYMSAAGSGSMSAYQSSGMIGSERVAHQVINKKPIKAIHDILDRCVFPGYKSCAPVYFRRKQGYKIAPLQHILENGPITGSFVHVPASGSSLQHVLTGYDDVVHMRPLSPPGEGHTGFNVADISGMLKSMSYLDIKKGHHKFLKGQAQQILSLPFIGQFPKLKKAAQDMLAEAQKSVRGGMNMLNVLDTSHQQLTVDKFGPSGYNLAQETLIAALTYSQKYWVSVPGQTGVNVTCGDRIDVTFPVGEIYVKKTLFVPRLIHEVRFTEGEERKPLEVNAKTEIYGVAWKQ